MVKLKAANNNFCFDTRTNIQRFLFRSELQKTTLSIIINLKAPLSILTFMSVVFRITLFLKNFQIKIKYNISLSNSHENKFACL